MAALFSPEGERARKAKDKAASPAPGARPASPQATRLSDAGKSQDSLGNPFSPGYEGPLKKKKSSDGQGEIEPESQATPAFSPPGFTVEQIGPRFIRLGIGWDKVLMAQKKLCEKAKNLFTKLEGPDKYRGQKKSKVLEAKYRGAIVDLDMESIRAEMEAEQKKAKLEEKLSQTEVKKLA